PLPIFVFDVDDCRSRSICAAAFEQHLLRGKVLFHGEVVVEVIAGEVGKDGYVEGNAVNSLLGERVGGNLHHGISRALAEGLRQNAIQVQRFRGSVRRGQNSSCHVVFDGSDEGALAASGRENRFQQESDGALAVGSRN